MPAKDQRRSPQANLLETVKADIALEIVRARRHGGASVTAVCVVIPCWNESETIVNTLTSLANQSSLPHVVVCVDDCSSDDTYEILTKFASERQFPFRLVAERTATRSLRAGAVNRGLEFVPKNSEFIVVMDGDTLLDRDAIGNALVELVANPDAGMICSTSYLHEGRGLLYRLQKLEYGGITHSRYLTSRNVLISHGLFSIIRRKALEAVGLRLSEDMLLEDYDLTVRVKLAGYRCIFSRYVRAYTGPPKTWRGLYRQRKRWSLGGLDIVTKFGWVDPVKSDIVSHFLFLTLFVAIVAWVVFRITMSGQVSFGFRFTWEPWYMIPLGVAILGYVYNMLSMRFVPNRNWKDWLIRLTIVLEIVYGTFLSWISVYCYLLKLFSRRRSW